MKDYALYPAHSISMSKDEVFKATIDEIFAKNEVRFVLESGTFKGTGSTTTLANSIIKNKANIEKFYTIEVDKKFYNIAVKNLEQFSFIEPIWGLSVDKATALNFIENDEAINNHQNYPDVYIDTLNNPKQFYIDEIDGKLSKAARQSFLKKLLSFGINKATVFTENVFHKLLPKLANSTSLILLDSAGGIGYLEFLTAIDYLKNSNYYIILDDIHHLKHYRSLEYIQAGNGFELIATSKKDGWAIAKHWVK